MRCCCYLFMLTCLLGGVSIGRPQTAAPTAPLLLSVQADTNVLLSYPVTRGRTAIDEPNYEVVGAHLNFTLTNTGATPLKLNTYGLSYFYLQAQVTGPEGNSVLTKPFQWERSMLPPRQESFPILQPGERWTSQESLTFPGRIGEHIYYLQRPGKYQVRILYAYTPGPHGDGYLYGKDQLANGAFRGVVASNPLTFTMLEAGPVNTGLQLALHAEPSPTPDDPGITLTGYARNAGATPLNIFAWNLYHAGLYVTGDDGQEIPFSGGADRSREAKLEEMYTTLKPGETHAYPLSGYYDAQSVANDAPQGSFSLMDATGFFRTWKVRGSGCYTTALLDAQQFPTPPPPGAPTPLWTGKVFAPRIVVPLNLTAHRQTLLKKDIVHFSLALNYRGEQDKPFYGLRLQVAPIEQVDRDIFYPLTAISETEATVLIENLAKTGYLRDMTSTEVAGASVPTTGYVLQIDGGKTTGASWQVNLGWNLTTDRHLRALQKILPAGAQKSMDTLLARLSGQRTVWAAIAALQQNRTSLTIPAGTLGQAAETVAKAAGVPGITLQIDDATRALPTPALQCANITPAEAFAALAQTVDINCTIRDATVKFMQWVQ